MSYGLYFQKENNLTEIETFAEIEVTHGKKDPKRLPLPDLIYTRVVKIRAIAELLESAQMSFSGKKILQCRQLLTLLCSHINTAL